MLLDFRSLEETASAQTVDAAPSDLTIAAPLAGLGLWAIAALLVISAPAATVAPGAATSQATAAVLTISAPAPGVGIGADAAALSIVAPSGGAAPGAVVRQGSAASTLAKSPLAGVGLRPAATPTLSVTAPDAAIAVTADAGALTVTSPPATVQPGAVVVDGTSNVVVITAPAATAVSADPQTVNVDEAPVFAIVAPDPSVTLPAGLGASPRPLASWDITRVTVIQHCDARAAVLTITAPSADVVVGPPDDTEWLLGLL
jgi:hypothetical protein